MIYKIMKIKLFILFGLFIYFTVKIYPQDNDIYILVDILPDSENVGLKLLYEYTDITKENIVIIKDGWVDLIGDNRNTEYYVKFYIEKTQMYHIRILSKRYPGLLYSLSWPASNEQYNVIFFKRNNNPYIIIDYRGGSGGYYIFSIFEYKYRELFFSPFKNIYEKILGVHGWFELKRDKIIFYMYDKKYILCFINNGYELMEYEE
jgi:hypothetical protein